MGYAGHGNPETFESPFVLTWTRENEDTKVFMAPAHATFDLHELSETDLRCIWSHFRN
jgi:hypothetical protein